MVFLWYYKQLAMVLQECCIFLHELVSGPTPCRCLVMGWSDIVGFRDASAYGVGVDVIGENTGIPPMVFCLSWPESIRRDVISVTNPGVSITNSDLEMATQVILFLVIEAVGRPLQGRHIALESDN